MAVLVVVGREKRRKGRKAQTRNEKTKKKTNLSLFAVEFSFSSPSITLALSLFARRLSYSCASVAPRQKLTMITGTRRGAAGVENTTPAEKLAKTMATKSIDAAPAPANNDEFPPLRVKKLVPEALLPVRGSAGAAGYDLAR